VTGVQTCALPIYSGKNSCDDNTSTVSGVVVN